MRALMASYSPFASACPDPKNGTQPAIRIRLFRDHALVTGDRRCECRHVALRALVENLLAFDHVEYGFGDIGGMVADPFDVLGAEHQMNAERDVEIGRASCRERD